MRNRVRALRLERGLRQDELARRAGISRQTLVLVEQGRIVPRLPTALRLARALAATVEDLFTEEVALPEGVPVQVARVGGRPHVAALTGPSSALDVLAVPDAFYGPPERGAWIGAGRPHADLVLAGCDPFAGWLKARLEARRADVRVVLRTMGSAAALAEVAAGRAHAAGVHGGNLEANRALAAAHLPVPFVLIGWLGWRAGVVWGEATRRKWEEVRTIVRRQPGAQAQVLLERILGRRGLAFDPGDRTAPLAHGHVQVAALVAAMPRAAGVACEPVARLFGLPFTAEREETYALVVPVDRLAEASVGALLETMAEEGWQALEALGVDVAARGRVVGDGRGTAPPTP